jgi:hypothetical protein
MAVFMSNACQLLPYLRKFPQQLTGNLAILEADRNFMTLNFCDFAYFFKSLNFHFFLFLFSKAKICSKNVLS